MNFTLDILIEAPLDICFEKFNLLNLKHWQRNLVSVEHLHGNPGALGAKMKLNYQNGNYPMSITETIMYQNFPHEFHCNYETNGMVNIQKNHFKTTPENYTKWKIENEFLPLNFKMRMMLSIMPKTFKTQSLQYMNDFKNFAENGISVCVN